jgi:hypothetical protein
MTLDSRNGQLSRRTKAAFLLIYVTLIVSISLVAIEYILRFAGLQPWHIDIAPVEVDPGGQLFQIHPVLGYSHIPGSFSVTLETGYSFTMTHLPDLSRITRQIDPGVVAGKKKEVWIFGCSYTHGWSINDEETYPWLISAMFPDFSVVNFGVGGYGTIHSLLQLKDALESSLPELVIVAYPDFHDERNTFARTRRKFMAPWNRLGPLFQPYARIDRHGNLHLSITDVEYREIPLMKHSSIVHAVEQLYNHLESKRLRGHAVTQALIMEMANISRQHDVAFVVALLSSRSKMVDFLKDRGIPYVDIAVNLSVPGNTNLPHDAHPSAVANQKYAARLVEYIDALIAEKE